MRECSNLHQRSQCSPTNCGIQPWDYTTQLDLRDMCPGSMDRWFKASSPAKLDVRLLRLLVVCLGTSDDCNAGSRLLAVGRGLQWQHLPTALNMAGL